jgi:hypothetical protein
MTALLLALVSGLELRHIVGLETVVRTGSFGRTAAEARRVRKS